MTKHWQRCCFSPCLSRIFFIAIQFFFLLIKFLYEVLLSRTQELKWKQSFDQFLLSVVAVVAVVVVVAVVAVVVVVASIAGYFQPPFFASDADWRIRLCPSGVNFIDMFTQRFYVPRFQKRKKDWWLDRIFCAFWDLLAQKLWVKHWWNWHKGSISSTFYIQLLLKQIPKAQKDWWLDCIFCTFGYLRA